MILNQKKSFLSLSPINFQWCCVGQCATNDFHLLLITQMNMFILASLMSSNRPIFSHWSGQVWVFRCLRLACVCACVWARCYIRTVCFSVQRLSCLKQNHYVIFRAILPGATTKTDSSVIGWRYLLLLDLFFHLDPLGPLNQYKALLNGHFLNVVCS